MPAMICRIHPTSFFIDLKRDPDQLVNFATDPEYASLLKLFREKNEAAIRAYSRAKPADIKSTAEK